MTVAGVAPGFSLKSASGETVHIQELRGRYVILCFSPRAGTPEWVRQAQGFRALSARLAERGAVVAMISSDRPTTLAGFSEGPCPVMLSDPDQAVQVAYGVMEPGGGSGSATFLLDRVGVVRQVWRRTEAEGRPEDVCAALCALSAADGSVNPLIQARRAYRAISDEPVAREDLNRLVEAAHLAPSCFNNQPWRFVAVDGEMLERVKRSLPGGNYWAQRAPAIIAVASRRDSDCKLSDARDYFLFGCGMATGLLMIQATQMGLIAHPIAGYDPLAVKQELAIPLEYVLITLIVVGRRGDVSALSDKHRGIELGPRDRRPLSAVLAWNTFGDLVHTEDA